MKLRACYSTTHKQIFFFLKTPCPFLRAEPLRNKMSFYFSQTSFSLKNRGREPASNTHAHTMGGGASKANEEKLHQENQELRKQLAEFKAQQSSVDERSAAQQRKETQPAGRNETQQGGVRRGEVSAEVREVNSLVDNYQKVQSDKSEEIRSLIAKAVDSSLLFNSLGSAEKEECVAAFSLERYKSGEQVITQNEVGNDFYVVNTGELEIIVKPVGGTRGVSKGMLSKGQSFGELALLYNTPRAATILAKTEVSLWVLTRDLFVTISTYFKHQRLLRYEKFLQKCDLFKTMEHEKLIRIAEALESEKHEAGEPIILQGEKGKHFYLIEEGEVRYEIQEPGSIEKKIVGGAKVGGFFGDRALMDDNDERTASVYAVTDVSLLCMERTMFRQLMKGLEAMMLTPAEKESQLRDALAVGAKFHKDIKFNELEIMRTLGEGAFGRVRLVKHTSTGGMYALKYLSKQHIVNNSNQEHVVNERNIMMMVDNPFVLKLHNTFQDSRYLYLLVELIHGGELFTLLRDLSRFSEKMSRFYAAGVVQGFEHLHERNICYRDLKPENLLLSKIGYIKIVDLGLAKVVPDRTWTLCGTPEYLAPEVILNKAHDRSVDNWALGILIYEMVTGMAPFEGADSLQTYTLILKSQFNFPDYLSRSCCGIITGMCQQNPSRRLGYAAGGTYDDVRRHHFYSGFDWKSFGELTLPAPHKPSISDDGDLSNFDEYDEVNTDSVPECDWAPDVF